MQEIKGKLNLYANAGTNATTSIGNHCPLPNRVFLKANPESSMTMTFPQKKLMGFYHWLLDYFRKCEKYKQKFTILNTFCSAKQSSQMYNTFIIYED